MTVPPYEPPPGDTTQPGTPPRPYEPPPGYTPAPGYGPPAGYDPGYDPGYGPGYGAAPYGPGYGAAPYGPGYGQRPEDTIWSVLSHLSIFVFALLGPLVVYLVFKDSSPMTRHHAAEALNFHITLLIATIVSGILMILLVGFVLLFAVFIYGIVMAIIAAVAAGNRQPYRYPLTIRFVS